MNKELNYLEKSSLPGNFAETSSLYEQAESNCEFVLKNILPKSLNRIISDHFNIN